MKKLITHCGALAGHVFALAACLACPALFFLLGQLSGSAARLPFMKIHPLYSGGEVTREYEAGGLLLRIHRPVFDGLLFERDEGFVQVDIIGTKAPEGELLLDLDNDGRQDLGLLITAIGTVQTRPIAEPVKGLQSWARSREGWIVRIALHNEHHAGGAEEGGM